MVKREISAVRRNELLRLIVNEGSIRVGEAAKRMKVTTETIRKDIIYLDKQGLVRKNHGGAVAVGDLAQQFLLNGADEYIQEKNDIALIALQFLPDTGTVILDSGSTTLALAKVISLKKALTVVTNSIEAASYLVNSGNKVYLTGGEVKGGEMSMIGYWTTEAFNSIKADVAFLGTKGFQNFDGPSADTFEEAHVKSTIIRNSQKVIVLADSTKLKSDGKLMYTRWKNIEYLITDRKIHNDDLQKLASKVNVLF